MSYPEHHIIQEVVIFIAVPTFIPEIPVKWNGL